MKLYFVSTSTIILTYDHRCARGVICYNSPGKILMRPLLSADPLLKIGVFEQFLRTNGDFLAIWGDFSYANFLSFAPLATLICI